MKCLSSSLLIAVLFVPLLAFSQQHFPREIPAGNYSGVCALGNDRYAVVSDKSEEDGFFVFHIVVDSVKGRITSIKNEGFHSCGQPNSDLEAICYCDDTKTLFVASEKSSEVKEYTLDGQLTGRQLQMPAAFKKIDKNYGIESLTYDDSSKQFLLTTEHPLLGDSLHCIQAFDQDLKPTRRYLYKSDKPLSTKHIYGASEICAVGDGRLLVLERQVLIPPKKIGAQTRIRIYETRLGEDIGLKKKLLKEFNTKLTLFDRSFGNYEAMCFVRPGLLLMMADSQNQYKGVLRDWFKIVKL